MMNLRAPGFPDGGESHAPNVLWQVAKWVTLLWAPVFFALGFGTLWPLLAWVVAFFFTAYEIVVEG